MGADKKAVVVLLADVAARPTASPVVASLVCHHPLCSPVKPATFRCCTAAAFCSDRCMRTDPTHTCRCSGCKRRAARCRHCGKTSLRASDLSRCSCGLALYCDAVCQKADWKCHKPEHKRTVAGDELPAAVAVSATFTADGSLLCRHCCPSVPQQPVGSTIGPLLHVGGGHECPVCLEPVAVAPQLCARGHAVCGSCFQQMFDKADTMAIRCPTCRIYMCPSKAQDEKAAIRAIGGQEAYELEPNQSSDNRETLNECLLATLRWTSLLRLLMSPGTVAEHMLELTFAVCPSMAPLARECVACPHRIETDRLNRLGATTTMEGFLGGLAQASAPFENGFPRERTILEEGDSMIRAIRALVRTPALFGKMRALMETDLSLLYVSNGRGLMRELHWPDWFAFGLELFHVHCGEDRASVLHALRRWCTGLAADRQRELAGKGSEP